MGTLRFAHPTLLIPYQDLFENEIALPGTCSEGIEPGTLLCIVELFMSARLRKAKTQILAGAMLKHRACQNLGFCFSDRHLENPTTWD